MSACSDESDAAARCRSVGLDGGTRRQAARAGELKYRRPCAGLIEAKAAFAARYVKKL
jgi:hypothetical protein